MTSKPIRGVSASRYPYRKTRRPKGLTKWRPDVINEALKLLADFKPSTTVEDGDKIEQAVMNKQYKDWQRAQKIIRPLKLGAKELGYIWYWCDCKFNWRGWSTPHGLAFKIAAHNSIQEASLR